MDKTDFLILLSDKVKRKYVKHDHEERVMAIKKALEDGWSIRAAARLINANHRQVSFWLSTYEKYGNLRPVRKHGSYSADFKRKVVSDIIRNSLTLQQATLKYGLPALQPFAHGGNDIINMDMRTKVKGQTPKVPVIQRGCRVYRAQYHEKRLQRGGP